MRKLPPNPSPNDIVRAVNELGQRIEAVASGGILPTRDVDMRGRRLINVGKPVDASDALTKAAVGGVAYAPLTSAYIVAGSVDNNLPNERLLSGSTSITLTDNGANGTMVISATQAYFDALYQPLDSDLTSIAALTTSSYGRGFLELADAAAALTYIGAAASTVTLQTAYTNSTSPEVTTDATRGALSLKRGSGADTDNVLEILNGSGTTKFAVTGEGKATGERYTFGTNGGWLESDSTSLWLRTSAGNPQGMEFNRSTGLIVIKDASNNSQMTIDPGNVTTTIFNKLVATDAQFTKLRNLTSNGFIKTSGGDGTLSVDTNTYLTTASAASTYQPLDSELTSWASVTRASGFDTFAATPSSANLASLLTDETGTGAAVFANTPTLVTPVLGAATGTSLNLTLGGTAHTMGASDVLALTNQALTTSQAFLTIKAGSSGIPGIDFYRGSAHKASILATGASGLILYGDDPSGTHTRVEMDSSGWFMRASASPATPVLQLLSSTYAADFRGKVTAPSADIAKLANLTSNGFVKTSGGDGTLSVDTATYQASDATLTSLAALGTAADKIAYTTGVDTWAETALTSTARTLLDDATTSDMRTTLGLAIGTDVQAYDADLASWASVTRASGFDTFVATPSSANFAALLTDEVGTSKVLFDTDSILLGEPTIGANNKRIKFTPTSGSDDYSLLLNSSNEFELRAAVGAFFTRTFKFGALGAVNMPFKQASGFNVSTLAFPASASSITITFPAVASTLATLAGTESLTNKKLGSLTGNGPIYTSGGDGTLNTASLTSGRIPYWNGSALVDDADLTFATDTLSAAKVQVVPGTASDDAKVGGVLYASAATVGNVGGGEDVLHTYTVPANTLSTNGESLRVTFAYTTAANTNSKTFYFVVDGDVIFQFGSSAYNNVKFVGTAIITRISSTTVGVAWIAHPSDATSSRIGYVTSAVTLSSSFVIQTTAISGAAVTDDCQQTYSLIEWLPVNT